MTDKRENSDRRGSQSSSESKAIKSGDRRELERRENETLVDFERRRDTCRREEQRRDGARRKN